MAVEAVIKICTPVPFENVSICSIYPEDNPHLSLHEASSGASGGSGEFFWFSTHSKLGGRVTCRFHVGEFIRALFTEIVETTGNHNFGLAREEGVAGNLQGL